MAYQISDVCTNCGACESACGFEAISEKGDVHWIDPDVCQSCGACESECPFGAISEA